VTRIFCGVDVSSATLDAQIRPGSIEGQFSATTEGIAALAAFCRQHGVELVVMEATGGYEKRAYTLLWNEGIPTAVVNPRLVRQFAQAMGSLEKTDRIDACMIAWFAEVKRIVPQEPPSAVQERLRALVTRLRQLTELNVAQRNQRRLVGDAGVAQGFSELLALLARQMREIETEIAALLAADPLWRALDRSFRSIKGVAGRTIARLVAEMPEIGTISNKAIAKLAGLAPLADDSGKRNGRRTTRGGRTNVRSILFVVAELVRRHNPDFADFHSRLRQAGKSPKVTRVAMARKLLVQLNAKARDMRGELALTA